MKKGLLLLGVLSLMLTGCGSDKSLVCTQQSDNLSTEMKTIYKSNKIDRVEVKMEFNLASIPEEELEGLDENGICDEIEQYVGYKLEDCKQTKNDKKLIITGKMPESKITDDKIKIDDLKNNIEKSGYTCEKK